jgi:repressor LexA
MSDLGNKKILAQNISYYMDKTGKTRKDICEALGLSYMTVSDWINGKTYPRIDKIELLARYFGCSKSDLVEKHHDRDNSSLPSNVSVPGAYPIPILGTVCAGDGVLNDSNYVGIFFVDKSIKADYCLNVHGDSMEGAGIHDGDIAFLRRDFELENGHIYGIVYGAENSAVLKKYYKTDQHVILQPCNEKYGPIIIDSDDDVWVLGELAGVYHKQEYDD